MSMVAFVEALPRCSVVRSGAFGRRRAVLGGARRVPALPYTGPVSAKGLAEGRT